MIVSQVIDKALNALGARSPNEPADNNEYQDYLTTLNMLIDMWAAQRLMSSALIKEGFSLVANTGSYTIGSGQTFNTSKPEEILSAYFRDTSSNYDRNVDIITREEYDSLSDKLTSTGAPQYLFYDLGATQQTVQAGTVYVHPLPDKAYTLYIESMKQFTEFSALTDTVTFPSYYQMAFVYNLAIAIAPDVGVSVTPEVVKLAEESLNTIKRINAQPIIQSLGYSLRSRFNINSGEFR